MSAETKERAPMQRWTVRLREPEKASPRLVAALAEMGSEIEAPRWYAAREQAEARLACERHEIEVEEKSW